MQKNRRERSRAAVRPTDQAWYKAWLNEASAQALTRCGVSRACSERPMRSIPFTTRSFGSAV